MSERTFSVAVSTSVRRLDAAVRRFVSEPASARAVLTSSMQASSARRSLVRSASASAGVPPRRCAAMPRRTSSTLPSLPSPSTEPPLAFSRTETPGPIVRTMAPASPRNASAPSGSYGRVPVSWPEKMYSPSYVALPELLACAMSWSIFMARSARSCWLSASLPPCTSVSRAVCRTSLMSPRASSVACAQPREACAVEM
jgi:hypothetical protein